MSLSTKYEARNPKFTCLRQARIQNPNVPMTKNNQDAVSRPNVTQTSLGHLDLGHSILPFDVAQGGELVEPFRISDFEFRFFRSIE